MGLANSSHLGLSGKQSRRAPCNVFRAADRPPEGITSTAWNCGENAVRKICASILPKRHVSAKKTLSVIFLTHRRPSLAGAVFSRWCLSVRNIGFPRPLRRPPVHPNPSQLYTDILWGNVGCEISRNNLFGWPNWNIDTGSQAND